MKIEISKYEVELIDKALESWEHAAGRDGMMSSLFATMLTPKDERESMRGEIQKFRDEGTSEGERRRRVATLLRAKLFQAEAADSEHTNQSEHAFTPPQADICKP